MKKLVILGLIVLVVLGLLIGGFAIYSLKVDDITKLNWSGTAYLPKDKWGTIIGYNNIFVDDIVTTNNAGNQDDVLIQILDGRGAIIVEPTLLKVGETMTFSNIPWNSGTVTVRAKTVTEGTYEFQVTNQTLEE